MSNLCSEKLEENSENDLNSLSKAPTQIDWFDFLSSNCQCDCCENKFSMMIDRYGGNVQRRDYINLEVLDDQLYSNKIVDAFGILTTKSRLEKENRLSQTSLEERRAYHTMKWDELGNSISADLMNRVSSDDEEMETEENESDDTHPPSTKRSKHSKGTHEKQSSTSAATVPTNPSQNRLKCRHEKCTRYSQGRSNFCITHGGGYRCTIENCNKAARGKLFCSMHGGGKRCTFPGCACGAVGKSDRCVAHGDWKRCANIHCSKYILFGASMFCDKHKK